jgi:hypothetical protein
MQRIRGTGSLWKSRERKVILKGGCSAIPGRRPRMYGLSSQWHQSWEGHLREMPQTTGKVSAVLPLRPWLLSSWEVGETVMGPDVCVLATELEA